MRLGEPHRFDVVSGLDLLEADEMIAGLAQQIEPVISHSRPHPPMDRGHDGTNRVVAA